MKSLKNFLKEFGLSLEELSIEEGLVRKHSKKFFLINHEMAKLLDSVNEYPVDEGFFLGETVNKVFTPSPYLLSLIVKRTDQIIVLNEKSSWLFICGRDIFKEGVVEILNRRANKFIVLNERKEVLGLCRKDGNQFKNLFDIGIFQRIKR